MNREAERNIDYKTKTLKNPRAFARCHQIEDSSIAESLLVNNDGVAHIVLGQCLGEGGHVDVAFQDLVELLGGELLATQ